MAVLEEGEFTVTVGFRNFSGREKNNSFRRFMSVFKSFILKKNDANSCHKVLFFLSYVELLAKDELKLEDIKDNEEYQLFETKNHPFRNF